MAAKWQIYQDVRGEYRWRLRAGNGEIVATGESYRDHRGVLRGIDAVRRAAHEASTAKIDDQTHTHDRPIQDRQDRQDRQERQDRRNRPGQETHHEAGTHPHTRAETVVPRQGEPADVERPIASGDTPMPR